MTKTNVFYLKGFSFQYPFSKQKIEINGELAIHHGECILLKGASGSGKSTLLMALKGLIPHLIHGKITGEILFHNKSIRAISAEESLKIGYLQQNPDSQLICHTVFDELAFGLENLSTPREKIIQLVTDISQKFAVSHLLDKSVKSLSGGQKQIINLLAILLLEPEVLLLDEPTAFLDPDSAYKLVNLIKEHIADKVVVIIEHNYHYFQPLVNRLINIDLNGNIHEENLDAKDWNQTLPSINHQIVNSKHQTLLTIDNLNFSYDNSETLLENINLDIGKGEIIGIIGKNGTGKSTLFKLICGIIPSKNQVLYNSQPVEKITKKQLWNDISLLWQNPESHFIHNTVEMELNGNLELAAELGLDKHLKSNPFCLSEGQKRRLSLGITLNKKPKLLLLDEPTFGQDLKNKQILGNILVKIAKEGTSLLIISHDPDFLRSITKKTYQLVNKSLEPCII